MRELSLNESKQVNGGIHIGVAIAAVAGGVQAYRKGENVTEGVVKGAVIALTGGGAALALKAGHYILGGILAGQSIFIASSD